MKTYMFHYVKPASNYHRFNVEKFEKVIIELMKNNHILSLKELDNAQINKSFFNNSIMLTFDDGTIDHYQYVYPILKKYNISGLFFIPSSIYTKKMLDIQLIHQLLEKESIETLFRDLETELNSRKIAINNLVIDKNLDNKKTATFKQLLQTKLPNNIRSELLTFFQKKYNISTDVTKTYISISQLQEMKKNGMFFGIHTVTHPHLDNLTEKEQEEEIKNNMNELLKDNLIESNLISIAFPYGSYNKETLKIMKKLNIKYGFKVDDKEQSITEENVILIDRLDCNELKDLLIEKE